MRRNCKMIHLQTCDYDKLGQDRQRAFQNKDIASFLHLHIDSQYNPDWSNLSFDNGNRICRFAAPEIKFLNFSELFQIFQNFSISFFEIFKIQRFVLWPWKVRFLES